MSLLKIVYNTIVEALFPLSPVEKELLSITPESSLAILEPVKDYSGLAVPPDYARNMHAIFSYKDKRVEKLIWNIKYKKSGHAVKIGGYALWDYLRKNYAGAGLITSSILIVPIPITQQRRRERGYNQCELLIDEIEKLNKEKANKNGGTAVNFLFENDFLIRVNRQGEQKLKNRKERVESTSNLFQMNEEVANQISKDVPIIVIDDVITTGSTMKEAMDSLRRAGFLNVRGVSVAH